MSIDRRPRGFTLIELIVFIVVVSVGLAGVLAVFNVTTRNSADPLLAKQAMAAADALLEEILLKDFSDPGGGAEADRQSWDNLDDYNGYASAGIFALNDLATPLLPGYNAGVQVLSPTAAIAGISATAIRRVTVTVTYAGGSVAATGYRFNHESP